MSTTLAQLSAILTQDYKVPADKLHLDTVLAQLGIDSLGTVELLWSVEDTFDIKLPLESAEAKTLGDVVRHIDDAVAARAAGGLGLASAAPVWHEP